MPKSTTYEARLPDASGHIAYDAADDAVWRDLITRQIPAVSDRMSQAYLDGLARLALPQDRVAQCAEVSATLRGLTGWRVEPVPALIPFGRFFALLADRALPLSPRRSARRGWRRRRPTTPG